MSKNSLTHMFLFINKSANYSIHMNTMLFFIVNSLTMNTYPFVHSDESWLGGQSLAYLQAKSIFVTEPFFDLVPVSGHTLASLFHLLQSGMILLFGYNISSLRLLSVIFATLGFFIVSLWIKTKYRNKLYIILLPWIIGLSSQYVYAAHMARQEIILFVILLLVFYIYDVFFLSSIDINPKKSMSSKASLTIGILLSLSMAIHPNAFVISGMIGLPIFMRWLLAIITKASNKNILLQSMLIIIGILLLSASLHVSLSLNANSNFFSDYYAYGSTLEVNAPLGQRLMNLYYFYYKLFLNISGTYFLPDIEPVFILSSLFVLLRIVFTVKNWLGVGKLSPFIQYFINHDPIVFDMLLMFLAFNICTFIIGRYNQTSILLGMLPLYIVILDSLVFFLNFIRTPKRFLHLKLLLICLLIGIDLLYLYEDIKISEYSNYTTYEAQIYQGILKSDYKDDLHILGNLTSGFVFKDMNFYDIRNLAYLETNIETGLVDEQTLINYLRKNQINIIIDYEEYDYIHRNPEWTILYGNDTYYEALSAIIETYCTEIDKFNAPYYGSRIIRYMGDYPWEVTIYQIDNPQ